MNNERATRQPQIRASVNEPGRQVRHAERRREEEEGRTECNAFASLMSYACPAHHPVSAQRKAHRALTAAAAAIKLGGTTGTLASAAASVLCLLHSSASPRRHCVAVRELPHTLPFDHRKRAASTRKRTGTGTDCTTAARIAHYAGGDSRFSCGQPGVAAAAASSSCCCCFTDTSEHSPSNHTKRLRLLLLLLLRLAPTAMRRGRCSRRYRQIQKVVGLIAHLHRNQGTKLQQRAPLWERRRIIFRSVPLPCCCCCCYRQCVSFSFSCGARMIIPLPLLLPLPLRYLIIVAATRVRCRAAATVCRVNVPYDGLLAFGGGSSRRSARRQATELHFHQLHWGLPLHIILLLLLLHLGRLHLVLRLLPVLLRGFFCGCLLLLAPPRQEAEAERCERKVLTEDPPPNNRALQPPGAAHSPLPPRHHHPLLLLFLPASLQLLPLQGLSLGLGLALLSPPSFAAAEAVVSSAGRRRCCHQVGAVVGQNHGHQRPTRAQ
jgi:hypothetical protein